MTSFQVDDDFVKVVRHRTNRITVSITLEGPGVGDVDHPILAMLAGASLRTFGDDETDLYPCRLCANRESKKQGGLCETCYLGVPHPGH